MYGQIGQAQSLVVMSSTITCCNDGRTLMYGQIGQAQSLVVMMGGP